MGDILGSFGVHNQPSEGMGHLLNLHARLLFSDGLYKGSYIKESNGNSITIKDVLGCPSFYC